MANYNPPEEILEALAKAIWHNEHPRKPWKQCEDKTYRIISAKHLINGVLLERKEFMEYAMQYEPIKVF